MISKSKIVIVGGGSVTWVPSIVKDMFLAEGLGDFEYVLYDIDKKSSDLCKQYLSKVARALGIKPRIISTDNRAQAFKGATYFIITISTGGLNSMAYDLAIPEDYGIFHTVGDTSGPGGWARAIRNFSVFVDLAKAINRYAPGAMILNYTNPMAMLTGVLSRICEGPVVGLCHGLFENIEFIKRFYKLKSEKELFLKYAGVNHFFWITEACAGNIDIVADINLRLKRKSLGKLLSEIYNDPKGFKSNREIADMLFRFTGVMPYLGDRHTCEFLPWCITNKRNMKKYKIVRTSIKERQKMLNDGRDKIRKMISTKIGSKYIEKSRETVADIISTHYLGKEFIDVGNLPNTGQISNLPHGTVVETAVVFNRTGINPIHFGALPEAVLALIEPQAHVLNMTAEACFDKNKKKALQALRLDPVCAHLNDDEVNEMGQRLLQIHKKYIKLS